VLRLLLPAWFWAATAMGAPVTVTDDMGRTITLAAPAERIVTLAPHLTEILFALGAGDRIVGTVRYSDYPEAAQKIPRLGDAFSVSVESVLALKPDIVLAWRSGGANRALDRIESLGVPVYFNESRRLDDIAGSIASIGRLVGRERVGREIAYRFSRDLLELLRKPGPNPVTVFFQISDQSLYTVNGTHLIGQAITHCGGSNLFEEAAAQVPLVSKEAVLAGHPDLIVITRVPGAPPSSWVSVWQNYDSLKGKVRTIDPNLISRPGPRMLQGIGEMCRLIEQAANP
jgi:iron complex transport system substrate-binding protein